MAFGPQSAISPKPSALTCRSRREKVNGRRLEPQPAKILTVADGAGRWRPQTRQHILFDDDPPCVATGAERVDRAGQRHHPAAQFAEDPAADRRVVVPALVAGRAREIGVAVLEVDVPDAIEIP